MSLRLHSIAPTEELIRRVQTELRDCGLEGGTDKWRILRLLLAISLRSQATQIPSASPERRRDAERGAEYRLQQITGEGTSTDFTELFRLLLSVQHDEDLFHPTRVHAFIPRLEGHLDQGTHLLAEAWTADRDLFAVLAELLSPPRAAISEQAASLPEPALKRALLEIDVRADLLGNPETGPRLTRYTLVLPEISSYDRLGPSLDKLAFILGLPTGSLRVRQGNQPRTLLLDLPRPRESWRGVGLPEFRQAIAGVPSGLSLGMCPGVGVLGAPVWLDLANAPHALLGGSTGSGKSVALHALLCSLLATTPKGQLRLTLIDLKRTELSAYRGLQAVPSEVITDAADALGALREASEDMERRYALLEGRGQRDLPGLRARGDDIPFRVIVVDELTDLVMQLPEAEAHLVRIAQKGRAAGVHLLLATQRPDAQTFSGNLRTNIPARIALAVQRSSESMIILGEGGAEGLLRPGDMLVRWGDSSMERAHSFNLKPAEVDLILREFGGAGP